MRIENPKYVCDWCKAPLDGEIIKYGSQKEREKHFASAKIVFGYSEGGWGNRKNYVDGQYDEICLDCFNRYKVIGLALASLVNGSRL